MRPFSDVDLHAFVDNQVSADRREAIATYLKTAPIDSARVDNWRRQNEAIRSVFAGVSSEAVPLWLKVGQVASGRDRTNAARDPLGKGPVQLLPPKAQWRENQQWPASKALIAAVLAFAAGLSVPYAAASLPFRVPVLDRFNFNRERPETARRDFARRTIEAHKTFTLDVDHPVEVADAPEGALRMWLARRVTFPVRIPNLWREGWTLRGGRVAPGDLGPGVLLVYQNGVADRLSLYMAEIAAPADRGLFHDVDATGVLSWVDGKVGYGIVSTRSAGSLSDESRELYTAIHDSNSDELSLP